MPDGVVAAVLVLADGLEAGLDEFADLVMFRLLGDADDVAQTRLPAETRTAVRAAVRAIAADAVARMREGAALPETLPDDVVTLARQWAGTGYGLEKVVDAHVIGQEMFWERVSEVSERVAVDPGIRWELIKEAHARLAGYTYHVTELFRHAHNRETETATGALNGRRAALVGRLLVGESIDPAELGYELEREHVALVADSRAATALPPLATRARRDLLQVAGSDGLVWAWIGGASPLRSAELDGLAEWLRGHDGRFALGETAGGVRGFRSSHRLALEAWAAANGGAERVTRFADVALLAALLRDHALAELFIERELGELAARATREATLRRTLRVYLEHRQSTSTTAALLGHDRKTIQRHLRSADALLPRPLAVRSAEVRIALRLLDLVGSDCV